MVAPDASRGDDHRLAGQRELADCLPTRTHSRAASLGSRTVPRTPSTAPSVTVSASTRWRNRSSTRPASHGSLNPSGERFDDSRAGAPGDVEAGDRVAVPVGQIAAALGPSDDGEEPQPLLTQPRPLLAGSEVDVRLRPAPRPRVLRAVEARGAQPVLPGKLAGVVDAHPALLGGVDEEEPAERPPGLAPEIRRRFLVDDHDSAAGISQLGRGDQPGKTCSHDDDIGVHAPIVAHPCVERLLFGSRCVSGRDMRYAVPVSAQVPTAVAATAAAALAGEPDRRPDGVPCPAGPLLAGPGRGAGRRVRRGRPRAGGERSSTWVRRAFVERPGALRLLDLKRHIEPDWFEGPSALGYAAYTDRFAGTLHGVIERVPYLAELGVTYLHLMPLLKPRPRPNDGGYAVMDYR